MARFLRYCLCVVVLVSPLAFSATRTVVVQPGELQPTYSPGQNPYAFSDSRSWKEPVSTQSGARVNVPVKTDRKYGWPSFRAGLKKALKLNPVRAAASAAVGAAVAGAGYVIDSATNQVVKPQSQVDGMPISGSGEFEPSRICFVKPASATMGKITQVTFGGVLYSVYVGPSGSAPSGYTLNNNCTQSYNGYYPDDKGLFPQSAHRVITINDVETLDIPASDADLDLITDRITNPADAVEAVPHIVDVPVTFDGPDDFDFSGPASIQGEPITTTTQGPDGTTVTTSTPSYSFDYSTNPLSITTTTNNTTTVYNNGTLVSTTTSTNAGTVVDAPPATEAPEVPTDCEFMPTVCEFIAWFKTPAPMPEPDMPEPVDDDFKQTYSASFGGACPAPRTVHTDNFGTLLISWQPICDLAFYIKFLVIGGASLFAAYIGLGISRGNS